MSVGSSSDGCARPPERPAGRYLLWFVTGSQFLRYLPGGIRSVGAAVWVAFIVFPLIDAIAAHGSAVEHGLVITGAALFVAVYVGMCLTWRFERRTRLTLLLFALLLSLATALTLGQAPGWAFLFTYCAACTGLIVGTRTGFYLVALCAVLAGVTSTIAGANGATAISYVAASAGVGLMMLLMSDLRLRNEQLSQARAELAQMAVANERERFARDLHDLLGHSLSVIALKAELAGRMLTDRPGDAGREVAELEQVARTALGEVRDAVSGYRQPTLEGELAGARMALSAAGIAADVQQAHEPLDPAIEAVLAWAVREGATNVIRHSGARHCTFRVTASLTDAGVEVTDDGAGAVPGETDDGLGHTAGANPTAPIDGDQTLDGARAAVMGYPSSDRARYGPAATAVDTRDQARGAHPDQRRGVNPVGDEFTGGTRATVTGGHGLAGLAERARMVNGTLEAGPLTGGGYRLAVTIPVSPT